jgi:hypothetical protein
LFVGVTQFHSVLIDADALELAFMRELLDKNDPVYIRYLQFNAIDAYLFPMEWISRIHEKDVIEVCRISPLDAQAGFSARDAASKTAGDSLAHFSAFFKRTWRSNDILWGRLDGMCQLIESLLTRQAIADAMSRDDVRERVRAKLLPSDGSPSPLDQWFRDCSQTAIGRIKSWIDRISNPATMETALDEFAPASGKTNQRTIRELLTEMAQFQVLQECLPDVFEDSIKEQVEWKQVRKQKGSSDDARLVWLGTDVGVTGAALDAVAAVGAKQLLQNLAGPRPVEESPKESPLGRSFNNFQIGSEEIAGGGVPFLVVSEITLKSLLVLRSCILGSFSEKAGRKIRASNFYRWIFEIPLRALYGFVVFYRSAPAFHAAILAGLTIFSILALFVGLKWSNAIIWTNGQINFLWFAVFIIGPIAWLSAGAYQLSRTSLREQFTDRVRNIFVAIFTAAPLLFIAMIYFKLTDLVWAFWSDDQPPGESRYIRLLQLLVIILYGALPAIMGFLGGYMALNLRRQQPELEDLSVALARMTESDLQDVADRMGEQFQVTPENRRKIVKALAVSAEMNDAVGKLERAIRAVSPGALG